MTSQNVPTVREVPAQSYLNYRGDVRDGMEVGQAKGLTTYGGPMYVVSFEYDEAEDRTRVGMSAVNPLAVSS